MWEILELNYLPVTPKLSLILLWKKKKEKPAFTGSCFQCCFIYPFFCLLFFFQLEVLKHYLDGGRNIFVMLGEGGETKYDTNINFLLEEFGIMVNNGAWNKNLYHVYSYGYICCRCILQSCVSFLSVIVSDAVVRNVYYKYFHPKEALVSNGVLNRYILTKWEHYDCFSFKKVTVYYRFITHKLKHLKHFTISIPMIVTHRSKQ